MNFMPLTPKDFRHRSSRGQQFLLVHIPRGQLHTARGAVDSIRIICNMSLQFHETPKDLQAGRYTTSRANLASAFLSAFPSGMIDAGY